MANSSQKYLQIIRGLPLYNSNRFRKETVEEAIDYSPHSNDIVISSYPKTGTTWLQYIIVQVLTKGNLFPVTAEMDKICPYMETVGKNVLDALSAPRMYMHHLPHNLMPKSDKAKYIYIYRRPEDTLVSYYHFLRSIRRQDLDFGSFFENFLNGDVGYGSYFEHVLSYLGDKKEYNLLLMSYESLHSDKKQQIMKIAAFLGENYLQDLIQDEDTLNRILEKTGFEYMKKNLSVACAWNNEDVAPVEVDFFRKGVVGEGKVFLSHDQLIQLKAVTTKVLKGTHILDEWLLAWEANT